MIEDALEHLVKGIVDHPSDVEVEQKTTKRGRTLEVTVNGEDLGRVIGRNGRTATSIRTVVNALQGGRSTRIDFVDVDAQ
ncbi:MAG: RNA-binding protein [Actinomycetes bacterium]|jgi:predicted RNA-binding protein YlqC (UPF0109 family)|nr:RNA-binding protein [Candidatus Nanopelagicales bacterium]MBJ7393809.1 RNA-binding protein [Candidatus Nanopelagicales bacterium]MCX6458062.1 RNA-binding protein [Actinomycetota bacterium]GDX16940.1 UPF0109 protein [Actinomycetes bacterium]